MEATLMPPATIRGLLSCDLAHTELRQDAISCCLVGEVFFELERLKKDGHPMTEVLSSSTQLHLALASGAAQMAVLDSQALENGVFENAIEDFTFFTPAVDATKHPSESVNVIVARDFDLTWTTEFLSERC